MIYLLAERCLTVFPVGIDVFIIADSIAAHGIVVVHIAVELFLQIGLDIDEKTFEAFVAAESSESLLAFEEEEADGFCTYDDPSSCSFHAFDA